MEVACVQRTNGDSSICLKPCSGLYVTSFSESEQVKELDEMIPLYEAYDQYKNVTIFPDRYTG